jgi:MFS family permease
MRPVLSLMVVVGLFFLTIGLALPVLPLYVHDGLGFDPFVVGVVAGGQFAAALVSRIWAGRLADTKGPRAALVLGLGAATLGGGLYLVSVTVAIHPLYAVAALLMGRTLLGAAESLILTGAIVWGLRLLPPGRAGKVISWVGVAMFAALAAGSPIGSWVYSATGFLGIALMTVAIPPIALVFLRAVPQVRPATGSRPHAAAVLSAVMAPGCALALAGLTFCAVTSFLTLFFASRGWQHGALAFTAFAGALIATRLMVGHLPDKLGGAKVATPSLVVQVIGLCLIAFADAPWIAMLGAGLTGAGFSLVFPSLGLEAVARVPEQSRGLAMGTYNAFLDATLGFAGPALGFLAASHGLSMVFVASAVAATCAVPIALRLQGRP